MITQQFIHRTKYFDQNFYIEMISVGEGDSFLLTLDTPDNAEVHVLIDGGDGQRANKIIDHVKKYATGHLDLVIGTHLDDRGLSCWRKRGFYTAKGQPLTWGFAEPFRRRYPKWT